MDIAALRRNLVVSGIDLVALKTARVVDAGSIRVGNGVRAEPD